MPASALASVGAMGLRAASSEGAVGEPDRVERQREVSDLMWRKSNYKVIDCECGTKLKIPPNIKASKIKCPHCGHVHQV